MEETNDSDTRVQCKYGAACYQKNEAHLKRFKHDKKTSPAKKDDDEPKAENGTQNEGTSSGSPPPKKQKTEESPKPVESKTEVVDKEEAKRIIKKMFLVDMPDEFYHFWDLCLQLNTKNPLDAFKDCNLKLVGPFEVLAGVLKEEEHKIPDTLTHWRYFYDPPEFQTLIRGDDKQQMHIGYYRDDPKEMPSYVASNCAAQDCLIKECGINLFAAVDFLVASQLKTADPFSKMKVKKLQTALQNKAKQENVVLIDKSASFARKRKVVCPTFHKGGLVVEYNKKSTVGYRQMETEAKLKKVLDSVANAETEERREKEMEALDSLITYANIANDECDFGGPLELGINMFSYGHAVFHPQIQGLLSSTYSLLNRTEYAKIIEAHINSGRKKGADLSIL